tara:strand:- start:429 stop:836 length:408 start_codon:yes stop_codon:yes gene_type:complete
VAVVAWHDVRTRTIPNWWVAIGLVAGLGLAVANGTLIPSLGGFGVALAIGIVPFALRALGAGDVKASMVVGSFVGVAGILQVLLLTALASGAIAWLYWSIQRYQQNEIPSTIPVGLPLACATLGSTIGFWLPSVG